MFHVVLFSNVQRLLALLGFQSRLLVRGIYNWQWTRLQNPVSLILCRLYHRGTTLGITPFPDGQESADGLHEPQERIPVIVIVDVFQIFIDE